MTSNARPSSIEPFPISLISDRYLLFDITVITHARREHQVGGVLIGTLPQFPQQNVFLGVPVELMPEEARMLVDKGAAFIVDEASNHAEKMPALPREGRRAFLMELEREGLEVARDVEKRAFVKREQALMKMWKGKADGKAAPSEGMGVTGTAGRADDSPCAVDDPAKSTASALDPETKQYAISPTLSYPPLPHPSRSQTSSRPKVPLSYPLYAHLHSKGYFLSPGLRFGCQYLVYPGDPLRFHSHFLAVSSSWDEEMDLMGVIGRGRLGTGVKKGFLVGGVELGPEEEERDDGDAVDSGRVRGFCIEWGGM